MLDRIRAPKIATKYVNTLNKRDYRNSLSLKIGALSEENLPLLVASLYFMNPYSVLSCTAMNLGVFSHLACLVSILSCMHLHAFLAGIFIAFATRFDFYNICLTLPLCLQVFHSSLCSHFERFKIIIHAQSSSQVSIHVIYFWVAFVGVTAFLLYTESSYTGLTCFDILWYTVLRMQFAPDLKPNIVSTYERKVCPRVLLGYLVVLFYGKL